MKQPSRNDKLKSDIDLLKLLKFDFEITVVDQKVRTLYYR